MRDQDILANPKIRRSKENRTKDVGHTRSQTEHEPYGFECC